MYQIAVLEDDAADRDRLVSLLRQECGTAARVTVLDLGQPLEACPFNPDILFVDVLLGARSGIRLARMANGLWPRCQVIFVTGRLEYAPDLYEARHLCLLSKDRLEELLPAALQRAYAALDADDAPVLAVPQKNGEVIIPQKDILYVERRLRVSYIHSVLRTVTSGRRLDDLAASLQPGRFALCHNSFLVNLAQVRRLQRSQVLLASGVVLPVSRSQYGAFREALGRHIGLDLNSHLPLVSPADPTPEPS